MSENSAQQSFFRRMMSQAESTTQITFEASKPRLIKSPARVAEQKVRQSKSAACFCQSKRLLEFLGMETETGVVSRVSQKAHRIAKFGPVEPLVFQIQPKEPASGEPDAPVAPVAPPTKFATRESFSQAFAHSAKGKMVVPMSTPRSVRTASKKGSTRRKRKRLQVTGAAVSIPKPSASSGTSGQSSYQKEKRSHRCMF